MDNDRKYYGRMHGGFGEKIEAGNRIVDFTLAYELAIMNNFSKRKGHYITYNNSENKSQIAYYM